MRSREPAESPTPAASRRAEPDCELEEALDEEDEE